MYITIPHNAEYIVLQQKYENQWSTFPLEVQVTY